MRVLVYIRRLIAVCIKSYYRGKKNTGKSIMFMPHTGFSKFDYIDLFNYRSDSAMTFARYLLDNNLCNDKEIIIFIPSDKYLKGSYEKACELYPNKRIIFLDWSYFFIDYSDPCCLKKMTVFCKCVNRSSHIFVSLSHRLEKYISNQVVVDLNYFPAPFKNEMFPKSSEYYIGLDKVGKKYSKMLFSSELSIRLMMPAMSLSREQFLDYGLCRNDNLLNEENFIELREQIVSSVSYHVNKVLLFTPTHRDYEKNASDVARTLFGFTFNLSDLDSVLRNEGILIVCKIHPNQNSSAFSKELPESVRIHQANHSYGLYELMKVSDGMIVDYSSSYFDYLLLDKPVIFNFYDVQKYKETRGFTYNPIESIIAGDIVKTPEELFTALCTIDGNHEKWKEKRAFVRDLIFTYQDNQCCKRVYDYFLK